MIKLLDSYVDLILTCIQIIKPNYLRSRMFDCMKTFQERILQVVLCFKGLFTTLKVAKRGNYKITIMKTLDLQYIETQTQYYMLLLRQYLGYQNEGVCIFKAYIVSSSIQISSFHRRIMYYASKAFHFEMALKLVHRRKNI